MNRQQFIDCLKSLRGSTIVSFVAETIPAMRKTNNPYFGRVIKRSRVVGMLGWIYENSVNAQRAREGSPVDFESAPRKWGQRVTGTPLVEHGGKWYLEVKVQSARSPEYYCDGGPIDREVIAEYLKSADDHGRQELNRPVILRDYAVESIQEFTCGGETFPIT